MSLFLSLYFIAAVLAAFGVVFAIFFASRGVGRFGSDGVIALYLWVILLGPTARLATAQREYLIDSTAAEYVATAGWVSWVLRLSSVTLMCVAAAVIVMGLSRRQRQPGAKLFAASLTLISLSMLTSATLGEKPVFIHNIYYALILLISLLMLPPLQPERVAVHAKRVLTVIMVGSLVLAAALPTQFAETNYVGIIPGFNIRLHGLAPHANALAPLALLSLMLAAWVPSRQPWQLVTVSSSALVLLLAQSKTTWIAGLLMAMIIVAFRLNKQFLNELRTARPGWATLIMFGIGLLSTVGLLWLLSDAASGMLQTVQQQKGVVTLTGRTDIWRTTIETWQRNPWFGYGPKLWDLEFRIANGGALAAWHAHNQFLQALGEAGLVGLFATTLYVSAFVYYGFQFAARTRGVSLALMLLVLVRTISEIPLRLNVMLDTTFFVQLVVFSVFLMLSREATVVSATSQPLRRASIQPVSA